MDDILGFLSLWVPNLAPVSFGVSICS